MKLVKWNQKNAEGFMLRITKEEGIKIIASIVNQIKGNSYNVYREEFDTVDGEYFSISVNEDLANVKD
jgi:hypothetical protein